MRSDAVSTLSRAKLYLQRFRTGTQARGVLASVTILARSTDNLSAHNAGGTPAVQITRTADILSASGAGETPAVQLAHGPI